MMKWIEEQKAITYLSDIPFMQYVYRNDGLIVGWSTTPERRQLNVQVWQIYIDGKKPTELRGAADDRIIVEDPTESQ